MNEPLSRLRAYLIRGIAGLLFLVMFLGAGAAALALFAAGINTLAGTAATPASPSAPVAATRAQQPAGAATNTSASQRSSATEASLFSGSNPSVPDTESGTAHVSYVDQLNNQIDHMHSPLGQSLDYGGVALGEQVQQTFGQVLSGVLKALFLEENGTPEGGGHP